MKPGSNVLHYPNQVLLKNQIHTESSSRILNYKNSFKDIKPHYKITTDRTFKRMSQNTGETQL